MLKMDLKDAVEKHCKSASLSNEQMTSLMDLQKNNLVDLSESKQHYDRKPSYLAFSNVAIVFCSIALICLTWGVTNYWKQPSIIDQIANEVSKNHLKMKPLEVISNDFQNVHQYFTKLDFSPTSSDVFQNAVPSSVQLLGGRYCSIKGIDAAQLRYKNEQGSIITLFEAAYHSQFKDLPNVDDGDKPLEVFDKGVKVKIWVEKGVVMVSTMVESQKP